MYKRIFANILVMEFIGSLVLSSCFVMLLFTYAQHKGIESRIAMYLVSQEDNHTPIEAFYQDLSYQNNKERLLHTLTHTDSSLKKIARQVAVASFISTPSLPLEPLAVVAHATMMIRRNKKKNIATNINYTRLERYSPLHKAYHNDALKEYLLVENYLLYTLEKRIDNPSEVKNIFAMRNYILKANSRLDFHYADTVARKIIEVAKKYDLPFILLGGLIGTESMYNKQAVSHVGATGLTQVYPKVWKKTLIQKGLITSIHDLYTIEKNIEAGAYILNSYYTLGKEMNHANPLRYALHRYYGARDNSYVARVYKHSQRIAQQIALLG